VRFDKVHVAAYSPRPGTIAWRNLDDDLPQEEKMRRLHAVEELQKRIATEINAALLDTTQEVLVEGEKDGTFTGRNRTNKLVHFKAEAPAYPSGAAIGEFVHVRIAKTTPWSLQGHRVTAGVAAVA
ncbi:MAG: TRAM domain-containing protein, partial [Chloroflexi bacterium]|nr:TRAM domain-containing protein [Chloroflexota bacterium]